MVTDFSAIRQLYHIDDNYGFSDDDILAYKKVCENLPNVLLDYYQQLGNCEFNHAIDCMLTLDEIYWDDGDEIVIFYQESEGVCDWGIALDDLTFDDALVFRQFDGDGWQQTIEIKDFLIAMAHWQAIFSLPFKSEKFLKLNADNFKMLEQNFAKKPFYLPHESDIYFYGNQPDDVISVEKTNDGYWINYASFDEQQFEKLDELLGKLGE